MGVQQIPVKLSVSMNIDYLQIPKNSIHEAGEMALRLRVLAALTEDPGLDLSTHTIHNCW